MEASHYIPQRNRDKSRYSDIKALALFVSAGPRMTLGVGSQCFLRGTKRMNRMSAVLVGQLDRVPDVWQPIAGLHTLGLGILAGPREVV